MFTTYPDASALVAAVQTGGTDIAYQVPYSDVERLSSGRTQMLVEPGAGNFNFMVNSAEGPTADVRVRRALDLALDRERFANTLLSGVTEPTCQIYSASSPAYDPELENCIFDLDAARQLLEEAGYADGFDLSVQVNREIVGELADFAQIYQADLAKIGVRLAIEELEQTAWLDAHVNRSFPGLSGHRYAFANQDPALLFVAFPFRATENSPRFESPEWADLIAEGQNATDLDARLAVYREIGAYAQEQAFNLPVADQPRAVAMASDLQDVALGNGDLALQLASATRAG